jgi:hypothetical protein
VELSTTCLDVLRVGHTAMNDDDWGNDWAEYDRVHRVVERWRERLRECRNEELLNEWDRRIGFSREYIAVLRDEIISRFHAGTLTPLPDDLVLHLMAEAVQ